MQPKVLRSRAADAPVPGLGYLARTPRRPISPSPRPPGGRMRNQCGANCAIGAALIVAQARGLLQNAPAFTGATSPLT